MSKFTKEMVDKYANLLLIGLSSEENKMVLDEFEVIDRTCDMVNNIKGINEVTPMTHCLDDFYATLSEDEFIESPKVEDLLRNSDGAMDREIEIPRVVE